MLTNEIENVVDMALGFWPKSSPADLSFLKKLLINLPLSDAKSILEDARLNSRYNSIPFKFIKSKIESLSKSIGGNWIECFALHQETGSGKNCLVMANTNDGARVQMAKYLSRYGMNPTDYIIFAGEDNHSEFRRQQFEIMADKNPKIRETAERLMKILQGGKSLVSAVEKSLPEIPKEPEINVGVRAKELIEALEENIGMDDIDLEYENQTSYPSSLSAGVTQSAPALNLQKMPPEKFAGKHWTQENYGQGGVKKTINPELLKQKIEVIKHADALLATGLERTGQGM